jgi:phospholipid/cholesterol/gamma-HCH transport system ATP-binding protein
MAKSDEPASPRGDPDEVVVEVNDLRVGYDEQTILNGVSMKVRRGEVMAIIGGSGSGKSTLLKCLLGILRPDAGSLRVLGVDMVSAPPVDVDDVYKKTGMVYQSGALFGSLTVGDNVALPLREHTKLDP